MNENPTEELKNLRKVERQKVIANGIEIILSRNISEPLNFSDAIKWCENEGGRLPSIEELEALYLEDKGISESFKGKTFWSSTEYYGDIWAYDFSKGKRALRSKEEKLSSNSISNEANTRTFYVAE